MQTISIKAKGLFSVKDPLSLIRDQKEQSRARAAERLQPSEPAKGIVGKLDPFRQQRYTEARRRWSAGSIKGEFYESPLSEAQYLLKELAISLEAKKDEKRLAVCAKVITLLSHPNLHEVRLKGDAADMLTSDAVMREWLGGPTAEDSEGPVLVSRNKSEPSAAKLPLTAFLNPSKSIMPEDELTVGKMLSDGLNTWFSPGFDSNELNRLTNENAMVALGMALHDRHNWADSLGISSSTMKSFLTELQGAYNPVAYHNSRHACDVTHGVHWMVTQLDGLLGVAASSEMLFACVVAALIHDVGHDGRGNAYHIATWDEKGGSEFSLVYSDQSPLERHHTYLGFRIMRNTGLLESLPLATRKAVMLPPDIAATRHIATCCTSR